MNSDEWEPRPLMPGKHLFLIIPLYGCVAIFAGILSKLTAVNIEVAIAAIRSRFAECEIRVARNTGDRSVPADEREFRLLMIKVKIRPQRLPSLGAMARIAGNGDLPVRITLIHGRPTVYAHHKHEGE